MGLSDQTLRYWRSHLASLAQKKGRSARFSMGDALALSIIKELVAGGYFAIGSIASLVDDIFALCNRRSWPELEVSILLIQIPERLEIFRINAPLPIIEHAMFLLPLRPHIIGIREKLIPQLTEEQQREFVFPPMLLQRQRK